MLARGSGPYLLLPLIVLIAASLPSLFWVPSLLQVLVVLLAFLAFAFLVYFFRDPARRIASGIVSPADGKVMRVDPESHQMSIFMGPQDVHVNRAPYGGVLRKRTYRAGSHVPAFKKESDRNERMEYALDTPIGEMRITQIAGMVARRIVPYVREGDRILKGQRIGLIRLGSRVDLEIPPQTVFVVQVGDVVRAGATTIAEVRT